MKLSRILGLLVIALLAAPFAFADGGLVNMQFGYVNGAQDGTYYVSPYYGTMNNQPVTLFCDDVRNEVTWGETWTANVTNLGAAIANSSFGNTRGSLVYSNPALEYEAAAYLASEIATTSLTDQTDLVALQYALWNVLDPGYISSNSGLAWTDYTTAMALAQNGQTNLNFSNFEIVTNGGPDFPLALSGPKQVQEFIIMTPEPGTLVLMLSGMLALALLAIARARLAV